MADKVTNAFIYEVLKKIQTDISEMKTGIVELKQGQIHIREDIHSVRGDVLRHDKALASLEVDIDRIKTRLDLSET